MPEGLFKERKASLLYPRIYITIFANKYNFTINLAFSTLPAGFLGSRSPETHLELLDGLEGVSTLGEGLFQVHAPRDANLLQAKPSHVDVGGAAATVASHHSSPTAPNSSTRHFYRWVILWNNHIDI